MPHERLSFWVSVVPVSSERRMSTGEHSSAGEPRSTYDSGDPPCELSALLEQVLAATERSPAPAWLPAAKALARLQVGPVQPQHLAPLIGLVLVDWFESTGYPESRRGVLNLRIADTILADPAASTQFNAWWRRLAENDGWAT